MLEAIVELKTI